jgi:hypothetical protein
MWLVIGEYWAGYMGVWYTIKIEYRHPSAALSCHRQVRSGRDGNISRYSFIYF